MENKWETIRKQLEESIAVAPGFFATVMVFEVGNLLGDPRIIWYPVYVFSKN